jgi:hypothetical protein
VYDLTQNAGGTTDAGGSAVIAGNPAIHWEGPGTALHAYVRGTDGHLLEYYKLGDPPVIRVFSKRLSTSSRSVALRA